MQDLDPEAVVLLVVMAAVPVLAIVWGDLRVVAVFALALVGLELATRGQS